MNAPVDPGPFNPQGQICSNLQFLLIRTPVMQSIDLRATRSRLAPYLSCARYHAPGPKVTVALPPRNGQGNGSHMPNRPCLCGCNACNGPIPLWPPPSDFCLPNHPNQARPNCIKPKAQLCQTPTPNDTYRRTKVTTSPIDTKRHQTSPIDTTTGDQSRYRPPVVRSVRRGNQR